jgi:cytochrome c oxidase subunit 2
LGWLLRAGARSCLLAAAVAACVGDSAPDVELSPVAARGRDVVADRGCRSCHSTSGRDGAGPTWKDLAGQEVELGDDSTVVADADYLRRSILDPGAEVVSGYGGSMPTYDLSDEDLDAVVAYLEALGTP